MPAERLGPASLNGRHHLELAQADMPCIGMPICGSVSSEDVGNLQPCARTRPAPHPGRFLRVLQVQLLERFKRAGCIPDHLGGDFGVLGGGCQFGMTKEHLDDPHIRPRFQKMRGKAVPQRVQALRAC